MAVACDPPRAPSLELPRDSTLPSVLLELIKPSITRLVMVTMACGAFAAPGVRSYVELGFALLGTALVVGAANALNMVLERDTDALMERTRTRPLPTRRVSPEVARALGLGLAAVGLPLLLGFSSPLVAALAAAALVLYVAVYTPLKRVSPIALHVGAIPGALPPLIGWAAATGTLTLPALIPFLILFVWQLPHFLAISLFRREDYARAGLRVLSVVRGREATRRAIVVHAVVLLGVSLLPVPFGLAGWPYLVAALLMGGGFLAYTISGFFQADLDRWARRVFLLTLPHLVLLFALLVAS